MSTSLLFCVTQAFIEIFYGLEVLLIGKWRGSALDYSSWFWISWAVLVLNFIHRWCTHYGFVYVNLICGYTDTHTHTQYLIYRSPLRSHLTEFSIISLAKAALLFLMGWNYFTASAQRFGKVHLTTRYLKAPTLSVCVDNVCVTALNLCMCVHPCVCNVGVPHCAPAWMCVRFCFECDNDLLIWRRNNLSPWKSAWCVFFSSLFTLFNSNLLLVLQAPVSLFIPRTAFLFFCNSPSLSLRHNDRPCLDVVVLRYPRESNLSCVILWSEVKVSCSVSHCRSPHILRLSHFSTLYHVTAVEGHHILQLSSMVTTAVSKWFLVRVK